MPLNIKPTPSCTGNRLTCVLGGEKWADAGPILSVLAVAILVQGFVGAMGSVFASAGRADRVGDFVVRHDPSHNVRPD